MGMHAGAENHHTRNATFIVGKNTTTGTAKNAIPTTIKLIDRGR